MPWSMAFVSFACAVFALVFMFMWARKDPADPRRFSYPPYLWAATVLAIVATIAAVD